MDWEEVAVADSAVVEVVEVEDLAAAATVLEDLAAVPAVDSAAAADCGGRWRICWISRQ